MNAPVPELYVNDPSPPASTAETCARASLALGPVYVTTPVLLLYAREPSPPASVTDIEPLDLASV